MLNKLLLPAYTLLSILTLIYTYIFVDAHLQLSTHSLYTIIQKTLSIFLYEKRIITAAMFVFFFLLWYGLYFLQLYFISINRYTVKKIIIAISMISSILLLSFPGFTYDIFNYILTAKLTYTYKENPYVVMPIEIANEPALGYTRAANKVALYGPTWLLLSFFPHAIGMGNVWLTIILFKLLVIGFYVFTVYAIWRLTKDIWNVVFFALNPLVISEILINGHNDMVMMGLVIMGFVLIRHKQFTHKILGYFFYGSSIFVKGASIILLPLMLWQRKFKKQHVYFYSFIALFAVFLLTPLREELYPWYAVWFLTFASLLPRKRYGWIQDFCIVVSIGLLFRHLPYILTREYGRLGPMLRILITIIPILLWIVWKRVHFFLILKRLLARN